LGVISFLCVSPAVSQVTKDPSAPAPVNIGDQIGGPITEAPPNCMPMAERVVLSSSPSAAIPDNNAAGVSDTITSSAFTIVDLDVELEITHTWIGDLRVGVEHNGTPVTLWLRNCTSTDDIMATADDEGTETMCAPINAGPSNSVFYAPGLANGSTSFLADFDGMNAGGEWKITIDDNFPADTGTLDSWSLRFLACPLPVSVPIVSTNVLGVLAFILLVVPSFLLLRGRRR
jgi:subtilisin-like proprotein convertase family protein